MPRGGLRKAWGSLSRLRIGVVLLVLLLGTVLVSTLFPQLPQQTGSAAWWAAVRDRYGFLFGPLRALGVFDLSAALWLKVLLGLLLLSTLACFLNRVLPLSSVVFRPRARTPAERFERAPLRADINLGSALAAESILREALRRRRYRVRVERRGQPEEHGRRCFDLRGDRNRIPRLGTLLTHLGMVLLILGAVLSSVRGWRNSALELAPDRITDVGHGTKASLRCDEFTILRYADGTPRDYRAKVTLVGENGESAAQDTLRVNHPFTYAGVSYYLQGFNLSSRSSAREETTESCSVLVAAVSDPGFAPVILGGFCLLVGVTLTFHFPHRRLWARTDATGHTTVVGSTAWDKDRFGRQFEELVVELRENEPGDNRDL